MGVFALILEFTVGLARVLWITITSCISAFLPIRKKDVKNEIVLVTGAGSGIGRLVAMKFAKLGAKVVLWDINEKANDAVKEEIKAMGGVAHSFKVDCSKRKEIYKTADDVRDQVGNVTILVNNAGIVSGKKLFEAPDEMVQLTMDINTTAHMWTIKAFVPYMKEKDHGHIITISSSAGLFGIASLVDYCGSKFGAVGVHESMVSELYIMKLDGVKMTLVCPFFINTGMFDGVKTRIPLLLPILEPEYAVNKIMDAYHSDQTMLLMPKILYFFYFMQSILPKQAMMVSGDFFGANVGMDTYKGRAKKD